MYLAPPVAVVCGVLEASSGFGVGWRNARGGGSIWRGDCALGCHSRLSLYGVLRLS